MDTFHEIPIIDIASYIENPETGIDSVSEKIHEAYTRVGFSYIINHSIPLTLIDAAFNAAKDFHALPLEEKLKIKQNKFFRGFMQINTATLKSIDESVNKPNHIANQSESFIIAHEVSADDPDFIAETNLAGPNQWPESLPPQFKEVVIEYHQKIVDLAKKMVKLFAVAFGLQPNDLDHYFIDPTTFMRLQYYPVQPNIIPDDHFGIAPHTDYGFLTLLAQDEVGGLQVRNHNGEWIEAPPLRGSFVLNTGDMLKRLSNDHFLSTPHRVNNRSGIKRYSIPVFIEPNMHAFIEPLPIFCDESNPKKYDKLEYYTHIMKRIRNNYDIGA